MGKEQKDLDTTVTELVGKQQSLPTFPIGNSVSEKDIEDFYGLIDRKARRVAQSNRKANVIPDRD